MKNRKYEKIDTETVLEMYKNGERDFINKNLDGVNLEGRTLEGASFYGSTLRDANLRRAKMTHIQLKGADLTGANLSKARVNASDLIGANFSHADMTNIDLTGASLNQAICQNTDMTGANLGNAILSRTDLSGAKLDRVNLRSHLSNLDLTSFCDAEKIIYSGHSAVDSLAIMKSYHHPGLKKFLLQCGIPAIFAEYQIDCARALGQPLLESMMQSTFISYGGPDEKFARRLYDTLREYSQVFFFPETATVGERISSEVFNNIQKHDRIILICSQASLDRPGVLHEIQETIDREARDGGETYLLPVMLDDYILTDWKLKQPLLAEVIGRRVVADFRGSQKSRKIYEKATGRLLDALKKKTP